MVVRASIDAVIAGVAATPVTKKGPRPIRDVMFEMAREAVEDSGLDPKDIDGLFLTPPGLNPELFMMFAAHMGKYLGIPTKTLTLVENGGVTAALALRFAVDEVTLGRCRAALVIAADHRTSVVDTSDFQQTLRQGAYAQVSLQGSYDGAFGAGAPIPFYAMSGQRYMHETGTTIEQVADCVVRLREHAAQHPGAQFREPATRDEILNAPMQSPPLTLPMCCPFSSGAAAAVVTSLDVAKGLKKPVARVTGVGEWHEPEHFCPVTGSMSEYKSAQMAVAEACTQAGIKSTDVDVAEVYGVFAPTELMLYEDLGWCAKGKAARWVAEGRNTWGGDIVVNPTGGRICYGHPAGATPLMEVVEVARQLTARAPGRQVPDARLGLIHAEHGCLNGSIVMTFERMGA